MACYITYMYISLTVRVYLLSPPGSCVLFIRSTRCFIRTSLNLCIISFLHTNENQKITNKNQVNICSFLQTFKDISRNTNTNWKEFTALSKWNSTSSQNNAHSCFMLIPDRASNKLCLCVLASWGHTQACGNKFPFSCFFYPKIHFTVILCSKT